jgi:hypothetical protein
VLQVKWHPTDRLTLYLLSQMQRPDLYRKLRL